MNDAGDDDAVLAAVRAKRGYLLPYHRLLAATDPQLLAVYDRWYERLTLSRRSLSATEREIVWIALVAVTRQQVGGLHLARGRDAGLSPRQIAACVELAAASDTWPTLAFAAEAWPAFYPEDGARARYLAVMEAAAGDLPDAAAHLAAAVCQAVHERWRPFAWHLEAAFARGAAVDDVAESLSFLIHHNGAPKLVAACEAWQHLAAAGRVPAPFADAL